jgi:hypothetical protein
VAAILSSRWCFWGIYPPLLHFYSSRRGGFGCPLHHFIFFVLIYFHFLYPFVAVVVAWKTFIVGVVMSSWRCNACCFHTFCVSLVDLKRWADAMPSKAEAWLAMSL